MSKLKVSAWQSVLAALVVCALSVPSAFGESHVRIVRLSTSEGTVQIDRNAGQGFEKAFLNLPIIEGAKLRAGHDGRAEVEFEDGSTIRLTPDTLIEFPQLSLQDSGARSSSVQVRQGMAYVSYMGKKVDQFNVGFGGENAHLTVPAHFRIEVNEAGAALAVFKGNVEIEGKAGTVELSKNRTASFDFANNDRYTIAKDIDGDSFDDWDKQQDKYHQSYIAKNTYSPYSYGTSDLSYYGTFQNVPGFGSMWQPYFIDASWNPYMDGAWAFYPGFGYLWASQYPWGWMPYRYGSWAFVPGFGWGWQPGNSWGGWNTIPTVVNPPTGFRPTQPPRSGQSTVLITRAPLATSGFSMSRKAVIRSDSAGLGIPRGSLRNPTQVASQVREHGSATVRIQPAPMPMSMAEGGRGSAPGTSMSRGGSPASSRETAAGGGSSRSAPSSSPRSAPVSAPSAQSSSMPHSSPSSSPAPSGTRR